MRKKETKSINQFPPEKDPNKREFYVVMQDLDAGEFILRYKSKKMYTLSDAEKEIREIPFWHKTPFVEYFIMHKDNVDRTETWADEKIKLTWTPKKKDKCKKTTKKRA